LILDLDVAQSVAFIYINFLQKHIRAFSDVLHFLYLVMQLFIELSKKLKIYLKY